MLCFFPVLIQLRLGSYFHQCNKTAALGNAFDVISSAAIVALIGPACSEEVQVQFLIFSLVKFKG